jgi:H+/Cl- antiporter ClcA
LSRRRLNAIRRHYRFLRFTSRHWHTRLVFLAGALTVGIVSIVFATVATKAEALFDHILVHPWLALIITPAGFLASVFLARAVFPGSEGSGIPQAIAARHFRDAKSREKLLSLRLTFGKILLTLFGLGFGASIGREGPTVQVGAAIMLATSRVGGGKMEKGLILAGSAAGIAAAFNTPLAGVVFAIEEMSKAFEQRTSGLVMIAVIFAGLASLAVLGNYTYFGTTSAVLTTWQDWVSVLFCGVAGGLLGGAFAKVVVWGTDKFRAFIAPAPMKRALIFAGICGLTVAICGVLSHGATYGTGYDAARHAVEGHYMHWGFAPLKFIATVASTLSGIPGGLFAPSLAVGAGLGSIVGNVMGLHSAGAIVVVGMAAYFAAVTQAPITSAVILGEMTNANEMVIPVMLAAFIGFGISQLIQRESLYHALAHGFIDTFAHTHKVD